MAIVKMKKLSVIGINDEKRKLMKDLMDLGVVEITDGSAKLQDEEWSRLVVRDGDEESVAQFESWIAKATNARNILAEHCKLDTPMFGRRTPVSEGTFEQKLQNVQTYEKEAKEIIALSGRLQDAYAEENAAESRKTSLEPWMNYKLPLELKETNRLKLCLGVIPPTADSNELSEKLAAEGYECEIELLRDQPGDPFKYLSFWYFKEDEGSVMEIAKSFGYSNFPLEDLTGSVEHNISVTEEHIAELAKQKESLIEAIQDQKKNQYDMEYLHDIYVMRRDEAKIRSRLLQTETTFTFDGWAPEAMVDKVTALLQKYTCYYEVADPTEEDDVPVRLDNGKFFSPIEFITNMYSLPSFNEVDPTSIYAIFYIIFFGIMFGDVGYGLLLVIGTLFALYKGKLYEGSAYKLMKVLLYSGFSSIFWGIMFGSFFGDLIQVVARTFFGKTITINPLWLDPAKEPMVFLVFSCGIGVVHLFVGMGIKAYEQIKAKQYLDVCKDVFAWYLIVIGLILVLFGSKVSPSAPGIGKWMAIVGVVAAFVLPFFTNQGISKGLGIWDLYSGITGNLSDILSYSRLLGLGLASTSIAQVFNFLASMGGKSFVGVVMFLLVALLGHTLNFAINALGAFVHSCRLQYVEFFGRFYEGGGRAFEPFDRETKYINIVEEVK